MAQSALESSSGTLSSHSTNITFEPFVTSFESPVLSLMECNHQPYDWFSYTIRVLLMVPVLIFGFAANAMNVIIFRQERMRTSMVNWYLVALAITDIGVLFSSFCMLSLPVICEDFDSLTLFNLGVSAQRWTYALGLTMQTASVGMTVLVSAHRFLGVVFPFRAQQWCTANRVKVAMWSVAVFSVGFNVPRWFEIGVDACQSTVYNATAIRLVLSDLRLDNLYYSAYMVILYTLFMFALPFLLLIIMNALIVRTVHRSYRLRQMLTNKISTTATTASAPAAGLQVLEKRKQSSPKPPAGVSPQHQLQVYERAPTAAADSGAGSGSSATTSSMKENKTTIMLIAVVFMFLLCNSLAFINNILEVLTAHGIPVMQAYLMSVEVSNFLVVINSASNIFIYWTFSARYRLLFRRYISYFCCCITPFASICAAGLQRRHHPASNNARGAVVAVAPGGGKRSSPNRLLMMPKNNGNDDVSPCKGISLHVAVPNAVCLRQNGFGNGDAQPASITRQAHTSSFRESKSEGKIPKRHARFRHCDNKASQPQEGPLLESDSGSDSGSPRKRASIVSTV